MSWRNQWLYCFWENNETLDVISGSVFPQTRSAHLRVCFCVHNRLLLSEWQTGGGPKSCTFLLQRLSAGVCVCIRHLTWWLQAWHAPVLRCHQTVIQLANREQVGGQLGWAGLVKGAGSYNILLKVLTKTEAQGCVCVHILCFILGHAGRFPPLSIICVVMVKTDTSSQVTSLTITPQRLSVNYLPLQQNKESFSETWVGRVGSYHHPAFASASPLLWHFSHSEQFGFKLDVYFLITVGGGELSEQLGPHSLAQLFLIERKKKWQKENGPEARLLHLMILE